MSQQILALGLGSNINPLFNLRFGLKQIRKIPSTTVLKISSIYHSNALLKENSPKTWNKFYLNAAILVKVDNFEPERFLLYLKKIEENSGRLQQTENQPTKWAPRTLDIDILWGENLNYQSEILNIPHLELFKRSFALNPLLEIAPQALSQKQLDQCRLERSQLDVLLKTHRSHQFCWPQFVGILNLTEDSFSDGGQLNSEKNLIDQIQKHLDDQAEVLDFGAESTRPGAQNITTEHEIKKITWALDIVNKNFNQKNFSISIDSRHPETIKAISQKYKVDQINDVEGFRDLKMISAAQDAARLNTELQFICMHSLSVPPIKTEIIANDELIYELLQWWNKKRELFIRADLNTDNLIFDLGIGFGKSAEMSFQLLKNLDLLSEIKNDFYLGYSRKSFLNLISNKNPIDRDPETADITEKLNLAFTQYIRVHDVKINRQRLLNNEF